MNEILSSPAATNAAIIVAVLLYWLLFSWLLGFLVSLFPSRQRLSAVLALVFPVGLPLAAMWVALLWLSLKGAARGALARQAIASWQESHPV